MRVVVLGGEGPVAAARDLAQALEALGATPQNIRREDQEAIQHAEVAFVFDPEGAEAVAALVREASPPDRPRASVVAVLTSGFDRAEALVDAGAQDVLCLPLGQGALRARLKAVAQRVREAQERFAIEDSQARFDLLFHNELDAISITDLDTGAFLDVNEAWQELYGYSREEAVGRMGPRDVSAEVSATQAAIFRNAGGGPPCKHVRWHRSRQGLEFPVEIYAGSYQLRGRRVLVAMIRNITDRVKLESQLRQADRMASVGTLAAGVAHEINNPLSFVLGNLEYVQGSVDRHLQGAPLDAGLLQEAVMEARDGARRVKEIVRDLKTFSRADDASSGPVDVAQVMDVALRLLGNELRHRARLSRLYRRAPRAQANEGRLGQVFVNLVTNALQALPDRPAEQNEVEVGVRPGEAGEVVAEVRDTGHGIHARDLSRIFDPFYTTKPVGEGTGLGLAICQSIIQGFGGRLEVESEPGKGATFRVVLPAAAAAAPRAPRAAPRPQEVEARRLRLLLIDDERNLGAVLGRALEPEVELDFVTDARDGLARISEGGEYDAVVCDLMMPTLSGMEFYEELQRVNAPLARRTGFITGGTFTPPARAFASRMTGRIIEKPFMAEDLHGLVRSLVFGSEPSP